MSETFVIVLRSPDQQAEFDKLRAVLTTTLGLDWLGMPGEPDGSDIAADCAEELWAAGFRLRDEARA